MFEVEDKFQGWWWLYYWRWTVETNSDDNYSQVQCPSDFWGLKMEKDWTAVIGPFEQFYFLIGWKCHLNSGSWLKMTSEKCASIFYQTEWSNAVYIWARI